MARLVDVNLYSLAVHSYGNHKTKVIHTVQCALVVISLNMLTYKFYKKMMCTKINEHDWRILQSNTHTCTMYTAAEFVHCSLGVVWYNN